MKRFLTASTAIIAFVLLAFVSGAGAQSLPGLDCDNDEPEGGDTLACEAGAMQPGSEFEWTATFAGGTTLTGSGDVGDFGDAEFTLFVPLEPGPFEVTVTGTAFPLGDYEQSFEGTVQASEETTTTTQQVDEFPEGGVDTGRGPTGSGLLIPLAALTLAAGATGLVLGARRRIGSLRAS